MAKIYPFPGIRYNLKKIKSVEKVICPPYDIIPPEEQKYYYRLDPANIIHLELPQGKYPAKYEKAKKIYQSWLKKEFLVREEKPAFYLYQHDFVYPDDGSSLSSKKFSRTGFFAALKLEPWGKSVYRHEKTFLKPKLDRLQLLSHLQANISPIFVLFSDPRKNISSLFSEEKKKEPLFRFTDSIRGKHQLWQINDKEKINFLEKFFTPKKLYIADGHHRYETALTYFQEQVTGCRLQVTGRILTYLCSFEEEGLLMLPTYRVVKFLNFGITKFEKWKKEKEKYFSSTLVRNQQVMLNNLGKDIGLIYRGNYYRLKLKNDAKEKLKRILPKNSSLYRNLPVTILHQFLLKGIKEENLTYTHTTEEAIELTERESNRIAFFFSSPKAEILKTFAETGEIMPEKSTYFYPKVPTGLVLYSLED